MRKRTPIEPTWLHRLLKKNPGEIPEKVLSVSCCDSNFTTWITMLISALLVIFCCVLGGVVLYLLEVDFEIFRKSLGVVMVVVLSLSIIGLSVYLDEKLFERTRIVERKIRAKIRRGELELIPTRK